MCYIKSMDAALFLKKMLARASLINFLWWLFGALVGAVISHWVGSYLDRSKEDDILSRYYVSSMPPQCRPKTSMELDEQVKKFKDATKRAKADGRGIAVWRDDCSIGVHYSIELNERIGVNDGSN